MFVIFAEVMFLLRRSKLGGNLLVEGSKVGFELFKFFSMPNMRAPIAWSVGRSTRSFSIRS